MKFYDIIRTDKIIFDSKTFTDILFATMSDLGYHSADVEYIQKDKSDRLVIKPARSNSTLFLAKNHSYNSITVEITNGSLYNVMAISIKYPKKRLEKAIKTILRIQKNIMLKDSIENTIRNDIDSLTDMFNKE